MYDVLVVGGGAAGFYAAIHVAEARPNTKIAILERGKEVLTKVRISGGGRCNVTHAEFNPKNLTLNYPRGEKELLGPFHQYSSGDTIRFFKERGIALKIEEDGRMFPESNSSQTIIDCFLSETERLGVHVKTLSAVKRITKSDKNNWNVHLENEVLSTKTIILATGSNPKIWKILESLGHKIISPVPSLFTFNIKDPRISSIPGVSTVAQVTVLVKKRQSQLSKQLKIQASNLFSEGPLLILSLIHI